MEEELELLDDELDVLDVELELLDEELVLLDELLLEELELLDELELLEVPPQAVSMSTVERVASPLRPVRRKLRDMLFSPSECLCCAEGDALVPQILTNGWAGLVAERENCDCDQNANATCRPPRM